MNVQDFSSLAWMTAGVAGIAAFWNQIKMVVQKLFTFFLVTSNLNEEIGSMVMAYMRLNLKEVVRGQRTYGTFFHFLKPLKKYGYVAVERSAKGKIFMSGWSPMFVTVSSGEGNEPPKLGRPRSGGAEASQSSKEISITTFRGTIDHEKFIAEAIDFLNKRKTDQSDHRPRYFVMRLSRFDEDLPVMIEDRAMGGIPLASRLLGYTNEEVGEPIPESPFKNLIYPDEVKTAISRSRFWMKSKDWYEERAIPWRMGMLFTGIPGTGKTSCAKAIAQDLNIPVILMDLTVMTNDDLVKAWERAKSYAPVMILLEDLDRVSVAKENERNQSFMGRDDKNGFSIKAPLSLDCLLNCISGIERSDGILVTATANDPSKLDPALTRPGRMDIIVEFPALTDDARHKIASRILPMKNTEDLDRILEIVKQGEGETGAQFTKRCADTALDLYWKQVS